MLATVLLIVAIVCITALEIAAILNDIDGVALTFAIAAIVGVPAYIFGKRRGRK